MKLIIARINNTDRNIKTACNKKGQKKSKQRALKPEKKQKQRAIKHFLTQIKITAGSKVETARIN
jgi:hypothetical protein